MLVTMREILADAKKNKYAIGYFNAVDLQMVKGTIDAAVEAKSPLIIGTAEVLLGFTTLKEVADMIIPKAKEANIPIALHFDHGYSEGLIQDALELGFTSIMYDCSMDDFETNVKKVSNINKIIKKYGATLEAELGHVGSNDGADESNSPEDHSVFTEPDRAKEFVERTDVDALAIAFGSAHGIYKQTPKLDIELLAKINKLVATPLVLHGGSGLTDADFRNSIQNGITKVNIFTHVNQAYAKSLAMHYKEGAGLTDLFHPSIEAIKKSVTEKIMLFGSNNRA